MPALKLLEAWSASTFKTFATPVTSSRQARARALQEMMNAHGPRQHSGRIDLSAFEQLNGSGR